jgi:hypothetical protein
MKNSQSREKNISTPAHSGVRSKLSEWSTDARVKEGRTCRKPSSVRQEKSSMCRQISAKDAQCTSINKKDFILKFVKQDASLIWPREMKMVNSLFKIFPNDDFWNSLELKFKLNSLCWFLSDDGRKFLNTEYKKFNFEPEKPETFEIKNNNIAFETKKGETVQAPMTVREFLTLWQKKN